MARENHVCSRLVSGTSGWGRCRGLLCSRAVKASSGLGRSDDDLGVQGGRRRPIPQPRTSGELAGGLTFGDGGPRCFLSGPASSVARQLRRLGCLAGEGNGSS